MMFWHIDEDIICLVFMIVLYASILNTTRDTTKVGKSFNRCVVACIICMVVDIAASLAMDFPPDSYWVYSGLMTLYFALILLSIFTWAVYVAELVYWQAPARARVAHIILTAVYLAYVLVIVANVWTGWIFTITADGVYSRGPMFAFTYIVYSVITVSLILFILIKWRTIVPAYLRWLMLLMPILISIGLIVQLSVPGWLTILPAQALALFISYMFIQNDWSRRLLGEKQEELRQASEAASLDSMTGVLNHNATLERIKGYLKLSEDRKLAVYMVDLDNFKAVNDNLGHQAGDDALRSVAGKISHCFRDSDIVGRIGGDEFLILMKNYDTPETVHRKAQELLETLQFECGDNGKAITLTASIGVSLHAADGKAVDQLCAEADAALYRAKSLGKNCYSIYNNETAVPVNNEPYSTVHLRTLLENMDGGLVLANVGQDIQVTYVSPSYYRTLAEEEDGLGGNPGDALRRVYSADRETFFATCRRAAMTGEASECTYRAGRFGDRWRLLRVARLSMSAEEGLIPVICVITDITELKKSEMMLDAIIKDSPTGIGVYEVMDDMTLKAVYLNEKAIRINDLDRDNYEEEIENDALAAVHPEDLPGIRQMIAEVEQGAPFDAVYRNNPRISKQPRRVHARCNAIGTQNGHPLLLVMFNEMKEGPSPSINGAMRCSGQ